MADTTVERPKSVWTGASGKTYTYVEYPYPVNFTPGHYGNYIYVRVENGTYVPIYFGEGELCDRCSDAHHQAACIKGKRPTHVLVHTTPGGTGAGCDEEADLLANYPMAYHPAGCNVKKGG